MEEGQTTQWPKEKHIKVQTTICKSLHRKPNIERMKSSKWGKCNSLFFRNALFVSGPRYLFLDVDVGDDMMQQT
jgi:hypothetical protein